MTGCFFFLTIVLAQFLLTKGEILRSFQEDGATATYHYQTLRQDAEEPIRWFLTVSGRAKTLASCRYYSMHCTNNYPASFDISFKSTFVDSVEYLYSDLTIKSHNSSMTQLECMDNIFRTTTWILEIIFKWPSQLICAPPTVEQFVIKVICSADGYPAYLDPEHPECSFDYMPPGSPLNYSVEFSRSRRSGPSCILKGRPNSGMNFSKTEYRFKAHMFNRNNWDVSSDWSPSITVELPNFTANGQRGAVVVNSRDRIQIVCSTDSDQPNRLYLKSSYDFVQWTSRLDNVFSYITWAYTSGMEYFCLAENSNPGYGILWDSIKIYVKGPLKLQYQQRNNTVYYTPLTSLEYSIKGYPGPTAFTLRSRTSESPQWKFSSDFDIQCQEKPSRIPPEYICSLFRLGSSMWWSNSSVDTEYMLEVLNDEDPSLMIAFTISRPPSTTTRTTTTTNRFPTTTFPWRLFTTTFRSSSDYGSYSNNRNSSAWILGPVLGCSLPLVILLLAVVICYRQRKAKRAMERPRPTAADGSSAPSSRPLIQHSQMTTNPPVRHNVYITSSSGSFSYDQRPSSGLETSVNRTGVTDGRSLQQLDAPPPYDLAAVTHYGHGNASASGEQPGLGYSYLQYATPPPYDTVGKPKEPPPPYPGI